MNCFWPDQTQKNPRVRKFVSAILGPEMAARILRTPGKMPSFCRKTLHVHKIPRFRGGGIWFWGGGGSADSIFMGARIFLTNRINSPIKDCGGPRALSLVGLRRPGICHHHRARTGLVTEVLRADEVHLSNYITPGKSIPKTRRNPKGDGRKGTGQKMS